MCDAGSGSSDLGKGMGVMLGLLGSIAINLGNNMQSLGMGKDANVKRLEEESLCVSQRSEPDPAAAASREPSSPPPSPPEQEAEAEAEAEHDSVDRTPPQLRIITPDGFAIGAELGAALQAALEWSDPSLKALRSAPEGEAESAPAAAPAVAPAASLKTRLSRNLSQGFTTEAPLPGEDEGGRRGRQGDRSPQHAMVEDPVQGLDRPPPPPRARVLRRTATKVGRELEAARSGKSGKLIHLIGAAAGVRMPSLCPA